jgi:3-oxo-5-alpha-steroid 4-dehydrogenase 1
MYNIGVIIVIIFTIVGWLVPLGIKIGYGRLKNSLFKLQVQPKLAWFLFEVPNLIWALYFIVYCNDSISLGYGLFIIHYINRDIIYPLRMKTTNPVPI